jgi:hypothetical protein
MAVEPPHDLDRVEADKVAPLDERNAPLGDEPPNVAGVHAEELGEFGDVEQPARQLDVIDVGGDGRAFLLADRGSCPTRPRNGRFGDRSLGLALLRPLRRPESLTRHRDFFSHLCKPRDAPVGDIAAFDHERYTTTTLDTIPSTRAP